MDKYDLIMKLLENNLLPDGKGGVRKITNEEAEKVRQAFKSMREDGIRGAHYLCEKCVHYVIFFPRATSSPGDEYSSKFPSKNPTI